MLQYIFPLLNLPSPVSVLSALTAEFMRREYLNTKRSTHKGSGIASNLKNFLKGNFINFFSLSKIDIGKGILAPFEHIFPLFFVLSISNHFKVQIPNIKIENDQTFVVGIVLRISR